MTNSTKFKITWSKSVKKISTLLSAAIIGTIVLLTYTMYYVTYNWQGLAILVLAYITYIYVIISIPISICIEPKTIVIKKIIGSKKINISEISDIYPFNNDSPCVTLSRSGTSGFFGYIGIFFNPDEGRYTSYVGNYDQAFMLVLHDGQKYMLSCQNRDLAIQLIKEKL